MQARTIRRIRMMGDSLSDRGTLAKRKLFGIIPMSEIAQLVHRSPESRFTNGFTWDDYFAAMLINEFIKQESHESAGELADDVVDGIADNRTDYTLDNDRSIDYKGRDFIQSFCEGGLTAHNYRYELIPHMQEEFFRAMVSNLAAKRQQLLELDKALTRDEKAETLIIEWSGGNDLITVNQRPNGDAIEKAIAARRSNLQELINHGYTNFVLMNLPDLSLTPRYQHLSEDEQKNAHDCSVAFNAELKELVDEFNGKAGINVELFDICTHFGNVYHHPDQYHFDSDKRKTPYTESDDFKKDAAVMPGCGAMFWDDIHPSAELHAVLASQIVDQLMRSYQFAMPKPQPKHNARIMFEEFMRAYHDKYAEDKGSIWFGSWSTSRLPEDFHGLFVESDDDYIKLIAKIIKHAFNDGGARTMKIMSEMGWLRSGQIDIQNDVLLAAKIFVDSNKQDVHGGSCSIQ